MAPLLKPADSFNSSSATIRPDREERDLPRPNLGGAGAGLGPTDSIGRDFESLLGGRLGVLQSDSALGDQSLLDRYLHGFGQLPSEVGTTGTGTIDPAAAGLARQPSEFNPMAFLNESTTNDTFFAQVGLDPPSGFVPPETPAPASASAAPAAPTEDVFRPRSAASNHSRVSLSSTDVDDSGFYTTDMDTDDNSVAGDFQPSPSPLLELNALNLGATAVPWGGSGAPTTIAPDAEALGSSAANAGASSRRLGAKRSVRNVDGSDPEEQRRIDRLEHRRSINRRSAQKHRLRRKEELETLTREITERDAKIQTLEKELAVTKAQLSQLASFVREHVQIPNRNAAAAAAAGVPRPT
ncbi:uncharacterized protein LOC62_01G000294 [Vanrija pseudolonga]|uniref:BZIP domain-containing protein n=1 Tax=Vanrija pseudolonga TaxID=143232 RepID=A0AAF0Y228_9TREE|nr:hypothetical protein LOC62_01G000294 [Vanrija pseudolonga]